jgi:biopolymer transport protein ExbD
MKLNRHRPNQLISGIDGIPFIHVAIVFSFVVLVIFLTLPIPVHGGITPILPRVSHPISMAHANREDAMIVTIFRDDKVLYRSDLVRPNELLAKIRESLKQGAEREVYIRADARARYSWVAKVVDDVRSAGVEKIGFLVEQRPSPKANPQ